MKVLVVNAGSSSLKYQVIEMNTETLLCKGGIERIGIEGSNLTQESGGKKYNVEKPLANHTEGFDLLIKCLTDKSVGGVLDDISEIEAVGHRVLHTGTDFDDSVLITPEALKILEKNAFLGPLHMPANIACVKSCMQVLPGVPNVAVFDTAFHTTMPAYAYMYAIPYEDYEQFKIRRYGFHGTSHKFVSQTAKKWLDDNGFASGKIVTCHLGNGSSITAVKDGKCVDTSMGMTPLEGVPMGTRSGDIDASVVEFLCNFKKMTVGEVITYLNKKSGFLGVSGVSSDSRNMLEEAHKGNKRAQLAADMFTYKVKKYIGSYAAAMGGLDCIVFTGGIGENSDEMRAGIVNGLKFLGVEVDKAENAKREKPPVREISTKASKVRVLIVPTNEELMIARDTKRIVKGE